MNRMVQKMTLPQAVEFLEFSQRWHLPDTETKRRMILIADRITKNKGIHHLSDGYFKSKIIKGSVSAASVMAGLRPITDEMLMNYIDGLSIVGLYFKYKRKQDEGEINRLVNPALKELTEFLSQEQWKDFVIDKEVAGDEICKINNMEIPFSTQAIKIHLKRMGIKLIFPSHVAKAKSDFRKYNIKLYGDETPIDNNLVNGKDDKLIITSTSKDNEIDHSKLLNALSKYISGISAVEFTNIIEHHSLTQGTPKAIWKGIPADAHRFATFLDMKLPAFNKCFSLSIGRKLRHNDKNETNSPIIAILEAHKKK